MSDTTSSDDLPERSYDTDPRSALEQPHEKDLLPVYLLRYDSRQTRRAYRNDLTRFFGSERITLQMARDITFVDVNEYLDDMQARDKKRSTMRRRLAAIRGFFEWLVAMEMLDHNPANRQLVRRIQRVNRNDRPILFLTTDQARALISATDQAGQSAPRDRALIKVLLHCVLRRSEAAGMDVEHVRKLGSHWIVDLPETKGGADQWVKIPDHVVDDIEKLKTHDGISSGPVWRSHSTNHTRGNRLSPEGIYRIVKRTAKRAGLDQSVGAHTLRHTGCTLAIAQGASVQQVKAHARHKNMDTTMLYVHQQHRLDDSAADYIDLEDTS